MYKDKESKPEPVKPSAEEIKQAMIDKAKVVKRQIVRK